MSSDDGKQFAIVLTTSLVTFATGFLFGVWTIQGYLIPPSFAAERRAYHNDPVESEESDVDEADTILDHAPNWANGLNADRRQGLSTTGPSGEKSIYDSKEECKLVLVVRTDLGMTKGKIAAQCSHATLACYKNLVGAPADSPKRKALARWERYGQTKIAVQIKSQDDLLELRRTARNMGVTAEVIQDAGRTQIEAGSMTVLGVGPAPRSVVDKITGHLKLL
ncbi:unnamed protein product [Clonostachys byssicola]|uniref:peptidyl-tRNA hydrolase n=1 Tax=Clonostachys byssicola TaxID=160290 RepID=A0A9N9U9I4_9HYPO|nr:unnamed protein product [Clonostachys byssicola]